MSNYSFIGKGSLYFQSSSSGALYPVGNVSKASITVEAETLQEEDYENEGGGIADSFSRIKAAKLALTLHHLDPVNLQLALFGSTPTVYAGGSVTDEAHNDVVLGSLIPLAHTPSASASLTVKKGATTYVENTDYLRKKSGLFIPATGSAILAGDDITVSYTGLADSTVQAMTGIPSDVRVFFDGMNESKSGRGVEVDMFKVKFSPAKAFDLIGKDFAVIDLEGDILRDDSKSGSGISKYFKVKLVAP